MAQVMITTYLVEQDGVGVSVGSEREQHGQRRLAEVREGLRRSGRAAVAEGRARPRPPHHRVAAALLVHRLEGHVDLASGSVMFGDIVIFCSANVL